MGILLCLLRLQFIMLPTPATTLATTKDMVLLPMAILATMQDTVLLPMAILATMQDTEMLPMAILATALLPMAVLATEVLQATEVQQATDPKATLLLVVKVATEHRATRKATQARPTEVTELIDKKVMPFLCTNNR